MDLFNTACLIHEESRTSPNRIKNIKHHSVANLTWIMHLLFYLLKEYSYLVLQIIIELKYLVPSVSSCSSLLVVPSQNEET